MLSRCRSAYVENAACCMYRILLEAMLSRNVFDIHVNRIFFLVRSHSVSPFEGPLYALWALGNYLSQSDKLKYMTTKTKGIWMLLCNVGAGFYRIQQHKTFKFAAQNSRLRLNLFEEK